MLSSLYGVKSLSTRNYTVTKHFNERKCVPELISCLSKGDIVIMDRGYYSNSLYDYFYQEKIHCVFRLKKDANKTARKFYNSNKTELNAKLLTKNNTFIPIRYIKYTINNKTYMLGTTITDMSSRQIKLLYKLRWGVETSFKRKKSYLNLNNIYARTEKLWKQEIQVRVLSYVIDKNTNKNSKG